MFRAIEQLVGEKNVIVAYDKLFVEIAYERIELVDKLKRLFGE